MKRIYVVTEIMSGERYLVEASTRAGSLNYIARKTLGAKLASQHELVALLQAGKSVEVADQPAQLDIEDEVELKSVAGVSTATGEDVPVASPTEATATEAPADAEKPATEEAVPSETHHGSRRHRAR